MKKDIIKNGIKVAEVGDPIDFVNRKRFNPMDFAISFGPKPSRVVSKQERDQWLDNKRKQLEQENSIKGNQVRKFDNLMEVHNKMSFGRSS